MLSAIRFATFAHIPNAFNARLVGDAAASAAIRKRTVISTSGNTNDQRLDELTRWVSGLPDMHGATLAVASEDASFRRYFRVSSGTETWIAMDAPPPVEDCRPFVKVAGFLGEMALNAPAIIAQDLERGFLLMSDLGSCQYMERLRADTGVADQLYADAVDALLTMQQRGKQFIAELPPYDEALLRFELALFHDWLCEKHLGIRFGAADEAAWLEVCDVVIENALRQPVVFVHRDYHSRNLMVTATKNPGILDFQDAVAGPLTYDLASLLKDCYVRLPAEFVNAWVTRFYQRMDDATRARIDAQQFERFFDLMGVQRHLKAAGIFARLFLRDGKRRYLPDIPQTLDYIVEVGPVYPELTELVAFIRERCLPALAVRK